MPPFSQDNHAIEHCGNIIPAHAFGVECPAAAAEAALQHEAAHPIDKPFEPQHLHKHGEEMWHDASENESETYLHGGIQTSHDWSIAQDYQSQNGAAAIEFTADVPQGFGDNGWSSFTGNSPGTTMGLYTIPERRVTFAGRIVGNEILDALDISPIPHVREYTRDDKLRMWYTQTEMNAMRKQCLRAAKAVAQDAEWYCPSFFRGLEGWIDQVIDIAEMSITVDGEEDDDSTSESRRWDAVEAVLNEQDQQRFASLQLHGMVYRGMMDDERVRSVYRTQGKTQRSQSIARAFALRDEADAKEWLEEDTKDRQGLKYVYNDEDECDHCQSKDDFSNGVRKVFQRLVTPILKVPQGNVYQRMGDECF